MSHRRDEWTIVTELDSLCVLQQHSAPAKIVIKPDQPIRTRPLRVALIASSYNYIKDGVALTLNHLVDHLQRQGVQVMVFAPVGRQAAFEHHGTLVRVPSVPLPGRPEYRLAFGVPVRRLKAFAPDIIHVAVAPDILGFTAWRAAKRWNITLVGSYHTRYEEYLQHYGCAAWSKPLLSAYLRRFYAACRQVYVPSESMADALRRDGFRDNLVLWPRGVDLAQFNPGRRSTAWRARLGIGDSDIVVLHVSRLVREKQTATLAATIRLLEQRGIPHRSVIVGDGPEKAALQQLLPRTAFLGFLQGDMLSEAYASADLFMFPSETETFGNVTLEAMASGLVCVCADATGSRSLVLQDETGFCVAPRDATAFADRLAQLIADDGLRRRMAAAAVQRCGAFSWDATMRNLLGCYQALADGKTA
jgi:phosphatidylinositol alpha 1,6-mannosyltransferase